MSDWSGFAEALDLDIFAEAAEPLFWSCLFDLLQADFDDETTSHLHEDGQGYGRLATERPVVPTRLPGPLNTLVRASDTSFFASGALADTSVLETVQDWLTLRELSGRMIALDVAGQLRKLGFENIRAFTLAELVGREMGHDRRIDSVLSARLGQVVSLDTIEKEPLHHERKQLLNVAAQAHFQARDGAWRRVRELSSAVGGGEDEKSLSDFAPDNALLSDSWGYPFNRSASRPPSVFGRRPPRPVCPWAFQARGMPSPFGRLGGQLPRPSAGNEILETHRLVGHGQLEPAIKHHAAAAGAAAIEAEHELVEVVAHVGTVGGPLMRSQQPPLGP